MGLHREGAAPFTGWKKIPSCKTLREDAQRFDESKEKKDEQETNRINDPGWIWIE